MEDLKWGRDAAIEMAKLVNTFPFPDFEQDYEFVAIHHPDEYGLIEGNLLSNKGINAPIREYDDHLIEEQVEHSTSLHTRVKGRDTCHVGPLARYSLNYEQLTPLAKSLAGELKLGKACRNPFKSIIVRGVEMVYAFDDAIRVVEEYEQPSQPRVDVKPRQNTGYGCTEAPRGICYHRYTIDEKGIIQDAKIVPPTAVNQAAIEKDLWHFIDPRIDWPADKLQRHCEQAIRNYDPCISCSTHFLKLNIDRR